MDFIATYTGQVLQVHPPEVCWKPCPVHEPSDHPLNEAPLHWRADMKLWERICPHGTGHPDPDDVAYKRITMLPAVFAGYCYESHGCCGERCCGN